MRIIAIANQKGGCGKTTTTVNTATALAQQGKKVLVIDLDSQAHSTLGFGYNLEYADKTIYDVIIKNTPITDAVVNGKIKGLELIPSDILLSGAEIELTSHPHREYVLIEKLTSAAYRYDFCIIDCSPSLSLLTLNALVAANEVIIPVQAHYYALEGLKQLLDTISIVRQRFNRNLKVLGLLLTFVEERTKLSRQIRQQMRDYFKDMMFDTVIHKTVRLAEAPSAGQPILTYAPQSKGAFEYKTFAEEVLSDGRD